MTESQYCTQFWTSPMVPLRSPFLLLLAALLVSGSVAAATAQILPEPALNLRYNPPNRGAPGTASTQDAGSRGCGLLAFTPVRTNWSETLQARPSFWLHGTNPGQVNFVLAVEATGEVVYQSTLALAAGNTVSQYALPAAAPSLDVDETYRWRFTLDCPGDPDPAISGVIVRRSLTETMQAQLSAASAEDQAILLSAAGFWPDAALVINQQRLEKPDSEIFQAAWIALLEQGGWEDALDEQQFGAIATAPLSPVPLLADSTDASCHPNHRQEDR